MRLARWRTEDQRAHVSAGGPADLPAVRLRAGDVAAGARNRALREEGTVILRKSRDFAHQRDQRRGGAHHREARRENDTQRGLELPGRRQQRRPAYDRGPDRGERLRPEEGHRGRHRTALVDLSSDVSYTLSHNGRMCKKNGDLKFMLLSIAVFASFASGSNLQRYLKEAAFISPGLFASAYGMQAMFLMLFRLFHNVIWFKLRPKWRIVLGIVFALCTYALQIAGQTIRFFPDRNNVWIAYLVFISNGIAVGTFDPNMLSALAGISSRARYYGALGITVGIDSIAVGAFLLIGLLNNLMSASYVCVLIFCVIIGLLLAALAVTLVYVPDYPLDSQVAQFSYLFQAFANLKKFYMPLIPHTISAMLTLFSISYFAPGITLFTISDYQHVVFCGIRMDTEYFRAIINAVGLIFGIGSRMVFERCEIVFPGWFLFCALTGDLMVISGVSEVYIVGCCLINVALGGVFIQSTKLISLCTADTKWALAAFSMWAFVGDVGYMTAGYSQQALVQQICGSMRSQLSKWDPCPYFWPE